MNLDDGAVVVRLISERSVLEMDLIRVNEELANQKILESTKAALLSLHHVLNINETVVPVETGMNSVESDPQPGPSRLRKILERLFVIYKKRFP